MLAFLFDFIWSGNDMEKTIKPTLDLNKVTASHLHADELHIAASILFNAYQNDPLFGDIFKAEEEGYKDRLRAAIREEIHTYWDAHQPIIGIYDGERIIAVACLIAPGAAFGEGRHWHWRLRMMLTAGFIGTKQLLEKEKKVRATIPATNFHMLSFIGVFPEYQRVGLGHVLMGAIDSVVLEDEKSEGVAVFVSVPNCDAFFSSGNYQLIDDCEVAGVVGQVMFKPRAKIHTSS
jgi:hypothetical protein